MIQLSRSVLRVSGTQAADFLQGLISNDVNLLDRQSAIYACLLTPQGKFLHDMFVVRADTDAFYLDVESGARADDLIGRLKNYRLRKKVDIHPVPDACVFACLDQIPKEGIVYLDPRHVEMGGRVISPTPTLPLEGGGGFEGWDKRRIALGIADGSRDAEIGLSTLEELNIVRHHGVSFDKGCYVGQELTARLHHRGLAKRHLVPVTLREGTSHSGPRARPQADPRINCGGNPEIRDPGLRRDDNHIFLNDQMVGELRSRCGDQALALLRDDVVPQGKKIILEPVDQGWRIR